MGKCIIWGAGYFGEYIQDAVLEYGYEIIAYCDSSKTGTIGKYEIITIENAVDICKNEDVSIVIGVKEEKYIKEIEIAIREMFSDSVKYEYGMDLYSCIQEKELERFYLNMQYCWDIDLKAEFLRWVKNIYSEVEYWVTDVADRRGISNKYNLKCRNNDKFSHRILVNKVSEGSIVLDIGCGLVSPYGDVLPDGKKIQFVPVDALAHYYNRINAQIKDGKRKDYKCNFGMFEFLGNCFGQNYADAIIINNALDHCIDPYRSIVECLYVLKVDGVLHMVHRRAEAVYEKWTGLHRWNVDCIDENLVLWNKEYAINVNEAISKYADVEVEYDNVSNREKQSVSVSITKKKEFELNQLLNVEKDTDILVSCIEILMEQQSRYNFQFEELLHMAQF